MNEENFQFLLNLLDKATNQLERVIGIVEKQNERIDHLSDMLSSQRNMLMNVHGRLVKLENEKEEN
jgi:hypothetical protein